jgi:hypothetical protein
VAMKPALVVVLLFGVSVLITIMGLTMVGARRRGRGLPLAALAGLMFPVTWTIWYLHDEHPFRRTAQHN